MVSLSNAEWDVMNVLWDRGESGLGEVRAALREQGSAWAGNTVQTFLTRLEKKGAVTVLREGPANLYRPVLRREDCRRAALSALRERVFGGSAAGLVSALLEDEALSKEELERLRALIDERWREG